MAAEAEREKDGLRRVAAILLAAGSSDRMGKPKLLLRIGGRRLIHHALEAAADSACAPVLVVLGAEASKVVWHLTDHHVLMTQNPEWATGISSSIRRGLEVALKADPMLDGVVLLAADQPMVTASHVDALIERWEKTGAPVVASRYADILGIPTLFARSMFSKLRTLEGDEGARRLIAEQAGSVEEVACPGAVHDVDTTFDLQRVEELMLGADREDASS